MRFIIRLGKTEVWMVTPVTWNWNEVNEQHTKRGDEVNERSVPSSAFVLSTVDQNHTYASA